MLANLGKTALYNEGDPGSIISLSVLSVTHVQHAFERGKYTSGPGGSKAG